MMVNNSIGQIQETFLNCVLNTLHKTTKEESGAAPSVDRELLESLSKSMEVGLESQTLLKPSLAVSFIEAFLLRIPLLNEDGTPAGKVVETQTSFKNTLDGSILHETTLLKGVPGTEYLRHDLEHAMCATDGAPKHISAFLPELLTTSFHRAIDEFFDELNDKLNDEKKSSEKSNDKKKSPEISKASFLTTRDRSPDTFGNYQPYLDSMAKVYKEILSERSETGKLKYEALISSILHLNYGMKEAFEELTLHGESIKTKDTEPSLENGTGFCLIPEALNELEVIHNNALERLKKIISEDNSDQARALLKKIPDSYWGLIK
jgi:hypothetical protein